MSSLAISLLVVGLLTLTGRLVLMAIFRNGPGIQAHSNRWLLVVGLLSGGSGALAAGGVALLLSWP